MNKCCKSTRRDENTGDKLASEIIADQEAKNKALGVATIALYVALAATTISRKK